jgi:hypothetical protein
MKNSVFRSFSILMFLTCFLVTSAFSPGKAFEPPDLGTFKFIEPAKSLVFLPAPVITTSAPINQNGKKNLVYTNLRIDCNNTANNGMTFINCTNIKIKNCIIYNSSGKGIVFSGCTNVQVDSCFVTDVNSGVYASLSTGVKVNSNQFLQMRGPYPGGNFIQFSKVYGGGNQIIRNRCEDIIPTSGSNPYPGGGDGISLYQSNGIPTDPIKCIGNWIRGGGTNTAALGMSGIVGGDVGGSYQDILYNILVNTGYVGIQVQGGTHINVLFNQIYSDKKPWSALGLGSANYSNALAGQNTITLNMVNWQAGYNNLVRRDTAYKAWGGSNHTGLFFNERPNGWSLNNINATNIDENILPKVIITRHL